MTHPFGTTRTAAWLGLLALILMWGSAFAAMNVAARDIPPFWIGAGRLWCGAAFVSAALWLKRERLPSPRQAPAAWKSYACVGVFTSALPFSLSAWGASHAPSALMGISNGAVPIFTGLLAAMLLPGDTMTLRRWLGIALGFAGICVLLWPDAQRVLQGAKLGDSALAGMLAGIVAAFAYASGNIIIQRAPSIGATAAATIFCITGALACTAAAVIFSPLPVNASRMSLLCVIALGVFPTGIASILYVWIVRTHGAVFSSLATFVSPVWATVIGMALLQEQIGIHAVLALVLILSGVALAGRR